MRVATFIDNSNVYKHLAGLHRIDNNWCKSYDPQHLSEELAGGRDLTTVMFYCAPPPTSLQNYNPNAYAKQLAYYSKVEKLDKVTLRYGNLALSDGTLREKNLDTQLTAEMIRMAAENEYDTAVLVSNDGDYVSAVETTKLFGKKVEVIYFPGEVSMNLKRSADLARRARISFFKQLDF